MITFHGHLEKCRTEVSADGMIRVRLFKACFYTREPSELGSAAEPRGRDISFCVCHTVKLPAN